MKYVNQKQVGHVPDNYADPLSFGDKMGYQAFVGSNDPKVPYKAYGSHPYGADGWIPNLLQDYTRDRHGLGIVEINQSA